MRQSIRVITGAALMVALSAGNAVAAPAVGSDNTVVADNTKLVSLSLIHI